MSVWLNAHGVRSRHEMLGKATSWDGYLRMLPVWADCCTYGWMLPQKHFDRVVVIRRKPADSAAAFALACPDWPSSIDWDDAYASLAAVDGLHVDFDELDGALEDIHGYLRLPWAFDRVLTQDLRELRIEHDVSAMESGLERAMKNMREALGL